MLQQQKLEWTDVDSSNIEAVAYHDESSTLAVRFKGGALYTYKGVDSETHVALVHAESVGRYLNQVIKVNFPYERHFTEGELMAWLKL